MGKKKNYENIKWYTFLIPALVFYVIFFWVPFLISFGYSFTDWNGIKANFVGLHNYIELFQDEEILSASKNTIFYTITISLIQNILGLLCALALRKSNKKNNILRTIMFLPYIFSNLVVSYMFRFIFEPNTGALNYYLELLHLESWKMSWLSDPSLARWVIVFASVYRCMGYTMVINIAGLQGISESYYEAAILDGASKWQQFKTVTFPLMAPATTINVVLCLIGNIQMYDQIYAITGGGPGYSTESVASTIYRLGFGSGGSRWGYGAAMSVVMFMVILVFTVFVTNVLRKREVEA